MKLLDRLERWCRPFAIPNLAMVLVIMQGATYVMVMLQPELLDGLLLSMQKVRAGEWHRLFSFMIIPPFTHPIFVFFALYLFYLMGTALEHEWGTVRFNLYIFIAYLATILTCVFVRDGVGTNAFISASVFLAFAYLFPDFELLLFFILPVKVKYLALLTWILMGWTVVTGTWVDGAMAIASVANFLLFFGVDIVQRMRRGQRQMHRKAMAIANRLQAFHRCHTCGTTEKDDPRMEFRVCSRCAGTHEYCTQHIGNHEHVVAEPTPATGGHDAVG